MDQWIPCIYLNAPLSCNNITVPLTLYVLHIFHLNIFVTNSQSVLELKLYCSLIEYSFECLGYQIDTNTKDIANHACMLIPE